MNTRTPRPERERQAEAEESFNTMFLKIDEVKEEINTEEFDEETRKIFALKDGDEKPQFTIEEASDIEKRTEVPFEIVNNDE